MPLVLARPSPYLHRAVAAAFLLSNGEAAPRTSTCLALPRLASRRVGSPQLDSPQVDSTRLDSLRFVPFRLTRLVSRFASPRLCSLVLADPEDCNSRSFSSDPHRFSDESRMISRLAGVAPLIKSYQESPIYLGTYIGCLRIVKPQLPWPIWR